MPGIISRTSTPLSPARHRALIIGSSMARYGVVIYTVCRAREIIWRNTSSAVASGLLSGPSTTV